MHQYKHFKLESQLNGTTVKFISERDYMRMGTKIKAIARLECETLVSDYQLHSMLGNELVNLSNDIYRQMLRSMRSSVIGGEANLREITHAMRDNTMALVHCANHHAHPYVTELMKLIDFLEDNLLSHATDHNAFHYSQEHKPDGELNCAYTETSAAGKARGRHRKVFKDADRGGVHTREETGADDTLLPPPDLDA